MRKNRNLQNIADKSLEIYNDEDVANELKAVIKSNSNKAPLKPSYKKPIIWSSIATAVLATVIVMMIVFVPVPDTSEDRNYLGSNQRSELSNAESLNADLSHFTLNLIEDGFIVRTFDTFYNETLYYMVSIEFDSGEFLEMIVVICKDYEFTFNHTFNNSFISDAFTLSYSETIEFLEDNIYYAESFGTIITSDEKIYLTYNGVVFDEDSNFIEYIQQIISIK